MFNIVLWVTVNISKNKNIQLNTVIGNVLINSFLNGISSFDFSYVRCRMECKKQKYIKKDTNGLKYIKQKKRNTNSIISFKDVFLITKFIRTIFNF